MKLSENRNIIVTKHSRYIQTGKFRNTPEKEREDFNLDSLIEFDYMGSFEYETNKGYDSLNRMKIYHDFYTLIEIPKYQDAFGNHLKVYASSYGMEHALKCIEILEKGEQDVQERTYFTLHIKDNPLRESEPTNFWWDMENDFFFFFGNEKLLMQVMDSQRDYEGEEKEEAFSKNQIKCLELNKRNTPFNTMKDYFYDKENKIHFLSFSKGSRIEEIVLVAFGIAKVHNGTVSFSLNGVLIQINPTSTLEEILNVYHLTLNDINEKEVSLEEVRKQYQENMQKLARQREFTKILRLISEKK